MVELLQVVGAVIELNGKILACRRRPEKEEGGKWEFPGGKIEPGESPREALERELAEELQLSNPGICELVSQEITKTRNANIELSCYRVYVKSPPNSSEDHDVLRWVSTDQLRELDWANADLPTVKALATSPRAESKN